MDIDGDGDFDALDYVLIEEMERGDEPGEANVGCLLIIVLAILFFNID